MKRFFSFLVISFLIAVFFLVFLHSVFARPIIDDDATITDDSSSGGVSWGDLFFNKFVE